MSNQRKQAKPKAVMVRIPDQDLYRALKTLSYLPPYIGFSDRRSVGGVILKLLNKNAAQLKAAADRAPKMMPPGRGLTKMLQAREQLAARRRQRQSPSGTF